jgi:hypothetical protein
MVALAWSRHMADRAAVRVSFVGAEYLMGNRRHVAFAEQEIANYLSERAGL